MSQKYYFRNQNLKIIPSKQIKNDVIIMYGTDMS